MDQLIKRVKKSDLKEASISADNSMSDSESSDSSSTLILKKKSVVAISESIQSISECMTSIGESQRDILKVNNDIVSYLQNLEKSKTAKTNMLVPSSHAED